MNRQLRHDRSPLIYATAREVVAYERQRRCQSILNLRHAREALHVLAATGAIGDTEGEQLRWKLLKLAAGIGISLVIAGPPHKPSCPSAVN